MALSSKLVQEAAALAFEEAMARMGADPAIRAECARITAEFAVAEGDGIGRD